MQFSGNGAVLFDAAVTAKQLNDLSTRLAYLQTLVNPISQVSQAKKIAPEVKTVVDKASRHMVEVLAVVKQMQEEIKQLKADRVPGQFTDRVVKIQGREGFKWQVML